MVNRRVKTKTKRGRRPIRRFQQATLTADDAVHRYAGAEQQLLVVTSQKNSNPFAISDLCLDMWSYNQLINVPDGMELVVRKVYDRNHGTPERVHPKLEVLLRPYLVRTDCERFPKRPTLAEMSE